MRPTPGHRFFVGLISLVWLIVNLLLFWKNGIKVVNDSRRYMIYATDLMSGFSFDDHNFWYIGFCLYLALMFKAFGTNLVAVVVGQYLLSFLAVLSLYRASLLLWDSKWSATATCLLFLGFVDVPMWNSYILTESIYISFTCISIYLLIRIYKRHPTVIDIIVTAIVVMFTVFIKPTGIALLTAIAGVVIYNVLIRIKSIALRVGLVTTITGLVLILANRMLRTYLVMENYQLGEIVYAVTTYYDQEIVQGLIVEPPDDLLFPSSAYPPVVRILLFIWHNPIYWTRLFMSKVFYLLFHIRPFWSGLHNVFSLIVLVPSYLLFFKGMRTRALDDRVITFAVTFLLVHILSVGITSEDWDGRFLMPMLPVIFIFSGNGMATLLSGFLKNWMPTDLTSSDNEIVRS